MAKPSPTSGGIFIALGVIVGAVIGIAKGQPSMGVLAGTALGIAAAVIWWLLQLVKR